MRLLALDLATVAGWAYTRPAAPGNDPGGVRYGAHRFAPRGCNDTSFFVAFETWLPVLLGEADPEAVIFEKPFISASGTNSRTTYRLMGLCVLTELLASHHGVPRVYQIAHQAVKKHWTGSGRAKKPDMIHAARLRGFAPEEDNAADALGVLSYGMARLCGQELAA